MVNSPVNENLDIFCLFLRNTKKKKKITYQVYPTTVEFHI